MVYFVPWFRTVLGIVVSVLLVSCGKSGTESAQEPAPTPPPAADLGVDITLLTPVVTNPYVAFGAVKRAVYEGTELDSETKKTVKIRTVSAVRDTPETVAGIKVTVVDVSDFDGDEMVEKTMDFYAQDTSGAVYYIGEQVDDYEGGKVVSHGGQWRAGENGARAGVFMPGAPKVGDVFEQERAPGVAQDRSKVVGLGRTVTVPAGTFKDCIETEDFDPIGKITQRKFYCRGVGLVREVTGDSRLIELIEYTAR